MSLQYKKNRYTCNTCNNSIITVDRDNGVTPFMIDCKSTDGCKGLMQSSLYRINQELIPSWEWYKVPESEYHLHSLYTQDHIRKGGLLLRKIEK